MTEQMKGYVGKQLRVKLGDGGMEIEDIREDWAQDYLGGAGYAAKLLYEELSPGVDPLGTEN